MDPLNISDFNGELHPLVENNIRDFWRGYAGLVHDWNEAIMDDGWHSINMSDLDAIAVSRLGVPESDRARYNWQTNSGGLLTLGWWLNGAHAATAQRGVVEYKMGCPTADGARSNSVELRI